jgi:hypothetical protein
MTQHVWFQVLCDFWKRFDYRPILVDLGPVIGLFRSKTALNQGVMFTDEYNYPLDTCWPLVHYW